MKILATCIATCAALIGGAAMAQPSSFPERTVTLVIPWAAGGGTDNVARMFATRLSDMWGKPVVVENVPGASGIIGTERVVRAKPDGHTIMITTNGNITSNRFQFKSLPYDADKDLIPVTQITNIEMLILANQDLPVSNLRELVELAKRDPGKITYASYGTGSQPHLLFELFKTRAGIDLTHVPYKGVSPAQTAVMSGETNLTVTGKGTGRPVIQSGRVKLLAYMSDKRDPTLPDVPTSAEAGFPYLKVPTWQGAFVPKGTPKEVVDKIARDIATIASDPKLRADMDSRGYQLIVSTPEQFRADIAEEVKLTEEMTKAAGIKPE